VGARLPLPAGHLAAHDRAECPFLFVYGIGLSILSWQLARGSNRRTVSCSGSAGWTRWSSWPTVAS
jgi:hypothetical protein